MVDRVATGEKIHCLSWTIMPLLQEIIQQVHELALHENNKLEPNQCSFEYFQLLSLTKTLPHSSLLMTLMTQ